MGSVCLLLVLVFYVASVMATKLFGSDFDAWFGTVGRSAYSLFQIMTLESWSMGIVRPVMELYPYAWAFFVPFILIVTFAVLNLFIAIIVNSMHEVAREETEEIAAGHDAVLVDLTAEIAELRREVAALNAARTRERPRRPAPESGA
jgi:voltage-gated sodium channel